VAGLFLLLANPVAAALQIIVYSGAIVVLVLFVIIDAQRPRGGTRDENPTPSSVGVARWWWRSWARELSDRGGIPNSCDPAEVWMWSP